MTSGRLLRLVSFVRAIPPRGFVRVELVHPALTPGAWRKSALWGFDVLRRACALEVQRSTNGRITHRSSDGAGYDAGGTIPDYPGCRSPMAVQRLDKNITLCQVYISR